MPRGDLDDFAYLWDGSEPGWVLWQLGEVERATTTATSIFNRITKMALVIEDDDLARDLIRQMKLNGAEVITEYPNA